MQTRCITFGQKSRPKRDNRRISVLCDDGNELYSFVPSRKNICLITLSAVSIATPDCSCNCRKIAQNVGEHLFKALKRKSDHNCMTCTMSLGSVLSGSSASVSRYLTRARHSSYLLKDFRAAREDKGKTTCPIVIHVSTATGPSPDTRRLVPSV